MDRKASEGYHVWKYIQLRTHQSCYLLFILGEPVSLMKGGIVGQYELPGVAMPKEIVESIQELP